MPSNYDRDVDKDWGRTLRRGLLLWIEGKNDRLRQPDPSPQAPVAAKTKMVASVFGLILLCVTYGDRILAALPGAR